MRLISFICFTILSFNLSAQVFWTEAFGAGACSGGALASAYVGPNGAWSVTNTGANGAAANNWFVSAKERGMGVGVCGAGCGGTQNKTLHLGSTGGFFNDLGASYNETGATNATDKRAESPVINCTGQVGITLSFSYMENGQGLLDNATLWYFDGTTWTQLSDPAKTLCCASAACTGFNQGLWVNYTIALPVSADNNPSVKIGFRWVNNGNGVGTDPSIAIDDVTLSTPVVLPVELVNFSCKFLPHTVLLQWETITERNSDRFEVFRSEDGSSFYSIGTVKASGNSNSSKKYSFPDTHASNAISYYKLKTIDTDNSFEYSKMLAVDGTNSSEFQNNCFLNANNELEMDEENILVNGFETVTIYNIEGKIIGDHSLKDNFQNGKTLISMQNLAQGIYLAQLKGPSSLKSYKIFVP